jgi:hypothetical protein
MRLQLVDENEQRTVTLVTAVQLVAPDERLITHYGDTALEYRRLPLRIRTNHPNEWNPLEYCLLGWQGAVDGAGQPLVYHPSLLPRLPGVIPEMLGPLRREANPAGHSGQATFTVRRLPSAQYHALLKSCTRRGDLHFGLLTLRVLEYGVLDWSGAVLDHQGKPVPFDKERIGWLPDETVSELWDILSAGELEVEEARKNSGRSSTGSAP